MGNPYFLLTLTAAIWGSSWMAASILSRSHVPAIYSALGRFVFGAAGLLLIMALKRPWPIPSLATAWRLAAMGFFGVFTYNICFFNGLRTVPAGRASLMAALQPSVVFLFSAVVWQEPVTRRKLAGLLLSLAGAILVLTQGNPGRLFANGLGTDDLWVFGTVVSWVAYTLIGRTIANEFESLPATAYSIWFGLLLLAADAILFPAPVPDLNTPTFFLVSAFLGLAGTTAGFLFYLRGIQQLGASRASIFINLVPVFSVLSSALYLHEPVTGPTIAGGLLAIGGVRLLNR